MTTTKSNHLAKFRQTFSRRYAPSDSRLLNFEIDLDQLIYAAFSLAQEPYVRELEMLRGHTLETAMLSPKPIVPETPEC